MWGPVDPCTNYSAYIVCLFLNCRVSADAYGLMRDEILLPGEKISIECFATLVSGKWPDIGGLINLQPRLLLLGSAHEPDLHLHSPEMGFVHWRLGEGSLVASKLAGLYFI